MPEMPATLPLVTAYVALPLARWHPKLLHYESTQTSAISSVLYEQQWQDSDVLRRELNDVRHLLLRYADLLAQIAHVPPLMLDSQSS